MANEDVEFLRDQVQRLNVVLGEYQQKYPASDPTSQEDVSLSPQTQWQTDKCLMSPLLTEYDRIIHHLTTDLDSQQKEQQNLRAQIDKLVAENLRVTRELKDAVQSKLHHLPSSSDVPLLDENSDDQFVSNLQLQLQVALQEKESAMEMFQAAQLEVERLEKLNREQGPSSRLHSLEAQAAQIKGQYMRTVSELNAEIDRQKEELRQSKTEHRVSSIQVTELRKTLDDMKTQLNRQEEERGHQAGARSSLDSRVAEAEKTNLQLQRQLEEAARNLESQKKETAALEMTLTQVQKKCVDLEHREYEAVQEVKESVQTVEAAMLEKDQALVREKQVMTESENLHQVLESLVEEAGARTRQEVDNVKKQCNQNISRLMEEIHSLEMASSERQAQMERAVREKRAAESELERLYKEGLQDGAKDGSAYEELSRRACQAESTRDDALLKVETLHAQLRRQQMTGSQEKQHLQSEVSSLQDRLSHLNLEFEAANGDRVKLCETVDDLKMKVARAEQDRSAAQRNATKQVTCAEQEGLIRERELEVRLQAAEDSHRSAALELRHMLTQQQSLSARWKEECSSTTERFERRIKEARSELSREKKRNNELSRLVRDSRAKTDEMELMLKEYTEHIKRMETRVKDTELRSTSRFTFERPLRAERDVILERKLMERDLERSLRESRNSVLSSVAEPLVISDLDAQSKVIRTNAEQDIST